MTRGWLSIQNIGRAKKSVPETSNVQGLHRHPARRQGLKASPSVNGDYTQKQGGTREITGLQLRDPNEYPCGGATHAISRRPIEWGSEF